MILLINGIKTLTHKNTENPRGSEISSTEQRCRKLWSYQRDMTPHSGKHEVTPNWTYSLVVGNRYEHAGGNMSIYYVKKTFLFSTCVFTAVTFLFSDRLPPKFISLLLLEIVMVLAYLFLFIYIYFNFSY